MDKFMESRWFMRIVGLLLAFLLYMTVNFDDITTENASNHTQSNAEVIEDVPLEAPYDQENLVISGLPSTVDVTVEGPKVIVQSAKALKDFQVYVDLTDIEIGKHQIPIKIRDISEKLTVTVDPSYVNVTVQERVTEEFAVGVEFNENVLAKGFEVENIAVEPKKVKLTGAKEAIKSVTYVKATLDIEDIVNETFTEEARVQVSDRELNKLSVSIEPQTIDVTVRVVNPSKTVPIVVKEKGSLPEGTKIASIELSPKEAKIFGRQKTLDAIKNISAEVDLTKIDKDTTVEVPLSPNEGLNKVTPEKVEVKIDVEEKIEKSITDTSFVPLGLENDLEYSVVKPEEGIEIIVKGFKDDLEEIDKNDFTLNLDLTNLEPGEHDIEITVKGPDNVEWELSDKNVKVQINEKTSV